MSNITINSIQGNNNYAVPTSDAELVTANTGLNAILSGVSGVGFNRCLSFVSTEDGGSPQRLLSARLDGFTYNSLEIPSSSDVVTLSAAIEAALLADSDIDGIGAIDIDLREEQREWLWSRSATSGIVPFGGEAFTPSIYDAGLGAGTILHSGAMPAGWTIKTTVPNAVIWLSFLSTANPASIAVRAVGDTSDPSASGKVSAQYNLSLLANDSTALCCYTNSSGQFEIKGGGSGTLRLQSAAYF